MTKKNKNLLLIGLAIAAFLAYKRSQAASELPPDATPAERLRAMFPGNWGSGNMTKAAAQRAKTGYNNPATTEGRG